MPPRLHVNVDHVATIRQQRHTRYPEPITAASIAELAGAHGITIHLREDRRHIQDRDVRLMRETVQTHLNFEMAATEEMMAIALETMPDTVTVVPERREELTTEGGLDVVTHLSTLEGYVKPLLERNVRCSLFIDPDITQLEATKKVGAQVVELSTASYTEATSEAERAKELQRLIEAARHGRDMGFEVACGHGLDYHNVQAVAEIAEIEEFNIGHSIVAHAIMVGFERAVKDMLRLLGHHV